MDHDEPWTFRGYTNAGWHAYGGWGVYLFFAISGLLVTTRILTDEAAFGKFFVGRFYARRFFRIQPAAFLYVGVIALLTALHLADQRWSSISGAFFLYQNYIFHSQNTSGDWYLTGHFWTLAVEEHFYLLLSLLLLSIRRWRITVFSVVLFTLLAFQRVAAHIGWATVDRSRQTEYALQYLIAPALLALLLRRAPIRDAAVRWLHPWVAFAITGVLKILWLGLHGLLPWRVGLLDLVITPSWILVYSFDLWVVATMLHPQSWTTRLLETTLLRGIGRLSYSLYLWHVLFVVGRLPGIGLPAWTAPLTARPGRYIATGAMALFSYYMVERPFIRLGHRLAPPATPGHKDLESRPTYV